MNPLIQEEILMAKNHGESIKNRSELISKTICTLEESLKGFPSGRIKIKKRKNGTYYYLSTDGKTDQLINKNDKLISDLIQKGYLKKALLLLKKEDKALKRAIGIYPTTLAEDLYSQLSEERKAYAKPIMVGDEEYARKWMEMPYSRKSFKKDMPVYLTLKGERVRSKSEVIIADRLYAHGIPYKYECPLKVGKKVIHPDFSILRLSDCSVVYHEHCGKMDDDTYMEDLAERVNDYSEAGIIQGDRLFFSFETSKKPLDVRTIDRLIDRHFR